MKDAVAAVIKRGEHFLLIKRAKKGAAEDYWCPVTGAVEPGETQEQAVVREAMEEMGVKVEPVRKVWECFTQDRAYRLHWWYVRLCSEGFNPAHSEVKDYAWLTCEQMQGLSLMFDADRYFFCTIGPTLDRAESE